MDTSQPFLETRRSVFQLVLISSAMAACAFGGASLGPLVETIKAGLGLSDNQIAIAQGTAVAVPTLLASIPLGLYVDHGRRVRLLQVLVVVTGLCALATALAQGPLAFVAARALSGIISASAYPVALSLVGDLFAPAARGRASMLLPVGSTIGAAGGYALGGNVANHFAADPQGWRTAMFVMATPLLLCALSLLLLREPPRRARRTTRFSLRHTFVMVWRYRGILVPLTIAMTTVSMADMASIIWTAPLMSRAFALDAAHVGAMISVAILLAGLATPVLTGVVSDRIFERKAVAGVILFTLSIALLTIPASLYPAARSIWAFVLGFGVFSAGGIAVHIEIALMFVLLAPSDLRGLFISTCSAASTLFSLGVAPLAVTILAPLVGGTLPLAGALAWVMFGTSLLSAAATAWMFVRQRPQPHPIEAAGVLRG